MFRSKRRTITGVLLVLGLDAARTFWLAPALQRLPADYSEHLNYEAEGEYIEAGKGSRFCFTLPVAA